MMQRAGVLCRSWYSDIQCCHTSKTRRTSVDVKDIIALIFYLCLLGVSYQLQSPPVAMMFTHPSLLQKSLSKRASRKICPCAKNVFHKDDINLTGLILFATIKNVYHKVSSCVEEIWGLAFNLHQNTLFWSIKEARREPKPRKQHTWETTIAFLIALLWIEKKEIEKNWAKLISKSTKTAKCYLNVW